MAQHQIYTQSEIRKLRITARHLIHTFGEGTFRTSFHGRGIEFATLREYVPGDDIRQIDWNTTARRGTPYIKTFEEERDLSVILAVDLSSSMDRKRDTVARVLALLAYLANYHEDRLGFLGFTDRVEFYVPARKNPSQPERLLHLFLSRPESTRKTSISGALLFLRRVLKKHTILFLVSDFLDRNYDKPMLAVSGKHEVVGIYTYDAIERALPEKAVLSAYDPESGNRITVDGYDPYTRREYGRMFDALKNYAKSSFARAAADLLMLPAGPDAELNLIRFLRRRQLSRIPLQIAGES